jgi:hypothetical protein
MKVRAKRTAIKGEVAHRHEADQLLAGPGSVVIVHRGVLRSLVMTCPDGCGDILTINLDERAGPAWRLYSDRRGTSLFPSVWRDSGCQSHFIVWRSHIFWCDFDDESMDEKNDEIERRVADALSYNFRTYVDIAQAIDEVPWAVLVACQRLARQDVAEAGVGKQRDSFRRRNL